MSVVPPKAAKIADVSVGPVRATSRHPTIRSPLRHLLAAAQAECLGGFEIDHHLILGHGLHSEVGWLFAPRRREGFIALLT